MKVKHKFSGGFLIIFLIAFIILNCFLGKAFINYHENKIKNEMDSLYKSSYSILRLYFQVNNLEGNKGNFNRYIPKISNDISEQGKCQIDVFNEALEKEYSYYLDDFSFDYERDGGYDVLKEANKNKAALNIYRDENAVKAYLAFPVYVDDSFLGNILLSKDYSKEHLELRDLMSNIKFIVSITFLLILIFTYFLFERIINPLNYIKNSFKRIGDGDFKINLKVNSKDEIGDLACGVNKMANKIEEQIEKINEEKEKVLTLEKTRTEFFNNITHELKTPLTNISGYAQIMSEEDFNDNDFRKFALERINKESKRMHELIVSLIEISKNKSDIEGGEIENVNLKTLIEDLCEDFKVKGDKQGICISNNLEDIKFMCREDEIRRIIINLLDNAIKYSIKGSEIEIRLFKDKEEKHIEIENFSDEISSEGVEKIFEPFYRENTKKSRELGGNGLGLYICSELVKKYGGDISFSYSNGKVKVSIIFK
ncbi:HAMP domain-containing sensor histidine kinase [Clostridium perfringens]|nr:HAMP domain-containing sensor histidine kinase [Clostridium perfringens]